MSPQTLSADQPSMAALSTAGAASSTSPSTSVVVERAKSDSTWISAAARARAG